MVYLPETMRNRLDVRLKTCSKRPTLDQNRLLQCLAILIKNAVEASPPQSSVLVTVEILNGQCVFRVMDRGACFPTHVVQRIGEPLVSSKSDTGGLGLGLFLVKAFAKEHG